MKNTPELIALIDRMLDWRQFPHYRLEFRADAVLSFAIPSLVKELFQDVEAIREEVIPEFPLPQKILDPTCEHYRSERLDYALFSADLRSLIIVELKTDGGSFRPKQTEKMERLTRLGADEICEWFDLLKTLRQRNKQKRKYDRLLSIIDKLYGESGSMSAPIRVFVLFLAPKNQKGKENSADGRVKWCTFQNANRILAGAPAEGEGTEMARYLIKRLSESGQ